MLALDTTGLRFAGLFAKSLFFPSFLRPDQALAPELIDPDHPPLTLLERCAAVLVTRHLWRTQRAGLQWFYDRQADLGRSQAVAFPVTGNAKYTWRKLIDHHPVWTTLSDKLAVKDWVRDQCIDVAVPRVLWTGTCPTDLTADTMPKGSMVKTNNSCGTNIPVRFGGPRERAMIQRRMTRHLAFDHSGRHQEWAYRNVPPRLLVEEQVAPPDMVEDVKVYMFGNRIGRIIRAHEKNGEMTGQTWEPDADGKLIHLTRLPAIAKRAMTTPLPAVWDEIIAISQQIGSHFDHVRVDLLCTGDSFWLGEITVYSQAGQLAYGGADPASHMSRWWDLRRAPTMQNPPRGWIGLYLRILRRWYDRHEKALLG